MPRMDLGACLKLAVEAFTRQAAALFIATLALLLGLGLLVAVTSWVAPVLGSLIGVLGAGLVLGGQASMALAVVRGEATDVSEALEALKRPVDYVVVGLALQAGALLFGVGAVITFTLFLFAPLFVAEGDDFATALGRSKDLALANLRSVITFAALMLLLNAVAAGISCGFGASVSLPFTMLAIVRLYHQLTGTPPPDASVPPPPASAPPSQRPARGPSRSPSRRPKPRS
jgi:hypothetical protein